MRKCVLIVLCLFFQMHRMAVGEGLEFTMIDVGMAECLIVTCGVETMMIDTAYPHVETAMTLMECGVSDIFTTEQVGNIHIKINKNGSYMISGQRMEQFILVK